METIIEKIIKISKSIIIPAIFLVSWQMLARFRPGSSRIYSSPIDVARGMIELIESGTTLQDSIWTIIRIIVGFSLGALSGFIVGKATGLNKFATNLLEPIIQLLRPIPAIALVPLALVWFGVGEFSRIFIVMWACFFPVWLNTHYGTSRVPSEIIWSALTLGASRKRVQHEVIIPFSIPGIIDGLHIGLGLAFAAVVVAEMSGTAIGLGYRIEQSHADLRYDLMIASIVIVGIFGFIADRMFIAIVHKAFPWIEVRELT